MTKEERMRKAIELSKENVENGGGPFGAVIAKMCIRDRFNPGRQQIDENGYDQYGNQVDPAMIPDRLDSANVEVKGLPPTLYM